MWIDPEMVRLSRPSVVARAVLINTIIDMVLISIHPFAVRKIFLLAVALIGLSSAFCFADPVFMTRQYAPSNDQGRRAHSVKAVVADQDEPSVTSVSLRLYRIAGATCAR